MANKMLIDASHPEETRVVVLRGNRVEEFDFESASKKQLRGNIYLAKVTRVEPSLQAAFVDYGGNRHGFLAFSEIHPDYYQIPVVDRQALIEEEARAQRDDDNDEATQRRSRRFRRDGDGRRAEKKSAADATLAEADAATADGGSAEAWEAGEIDAAENEAPSAVAADESRHDASDDDSSEFSEAGAGAEGEDGAAGSQDRAEPFLGAPGGAEAAAEAQAETPVEGDAETAENAGDSAGQRARGPAADDEGEEEDEHVEHLGGDAMEDIPTRPQRYRKQYKIQEVIKRRQVLLVQVVKEERGNKGAALTTYLSLAGRYSVLMPNTARGGGISRKITDSADRSRLKSIAQELEVPDGMGVILRTAGASRTKPEVKRDFEYLLRMWETVRETTLKSTAPTLVYEEGSLIKRAIRDLYNKDVDDIVVAGDKGFREARDFMRLLMPSHVRSVQAYRDPQPIFAKSGVEAQLDAMFLNQVTLKSGGYIVINQTEALVAIDVNSGRSTREHNIEDTALRTNLEAADEIARQLRLRDLAGLIVIDFIDMEEGRNNRAVERRLKDALKNDRARIQVGRISHFGLMEMSRQRIRTGVLEGSTEICPHCSGSGILRSTASIALHVLRVVEDALIKSASHDLIVRTRTPVALYILNEKRATLRDLERRFGVAVTVGADDSLIGGAYHAIERGEPASGGHEPLTLAAGAAPALDDEDEIEGGFDRADAGGGDDWAAPVPEAGPDEEFAAESGERREGESEADAETRRRRRRRRRRGRGCDREGSGIAANAPQPPDDALEVVARMGDVQPIRAPQPSFDSPRDDAGAQSGETLEAAATPETVGGEDFEAAPARAGRSRRRGKAREAAADAAAPADAAPGAEPDIEADAAAAPRRARRAPRARTPRRLPAAADAASDAAVAAALAEPLTDDGAGAALEAQSAPEQTRPIEAAGAAPAPEPPAAAQPVARSPEQQPDDPSRPKRSGWWQRAKASLGR